MTRSRLPAAGVPTPEEEGSHMSDTVHDTSSPGGEAAVLRRLSTLDRFLPVWILVAMDLIT